MKKFEVNGKKCVVKKPSAEDKRKAQALNLKTFGDLVNDGVLTRSRLDDVLRKQGLWDDDKEAEFQRLRNELKEAEIKIKSGGFKLSEARSLAIKMRQMRREMMSLLRPRTDLDAKTAEGVAADTEFNYLVSVCILDEETQKPYFKNLDDFIERSDDKVALEGAKILASIVSDYDEEFQNKLPENEFLLKYNMVDEELRLVNKTGHLVSEDGKLINKNGQYVNENGDLVDIDGNKVDDDGNLVLEFHEFEDDWNILAEEKPKRGRRKKEETETEAGV